MITGHVTSQLRISQMLDERDQGLTLGLIGFVLPEVLYAGTLSVTQII